MKKMCLVFLAIAVLCLPVFAWAEEGKLDADDIAFLNGSDQATKATETPDPGPKPAGDVGGNDTVKVLKVEKLVVNESVVGKQDVHRQDVKRQHVRRQVVRHSHVLKQTVKHQEVEQADINVANIKTANIETANIQEANIDTAYVNTLYAQVAHLGTGGGVARGSGGGLCVDGKCVPGHWVKSKTHWNALGDGIDVVDIEDTGKPAGSALSKIWIPAHSGKNFAANVARVQVSRYNGQSTEAASKAAIARAMQLKGHASKYNGKAQGKDMVCEPMLHR